MTVPNEFHATKPLNPRLVTKTSLPQPRKAIALFLALWFASNKPAQLEYGVEDGKNITISDNQMDKLLSFFIGHDFDDDMRFKFSQEISNNPLLTGQIEALNVAFELIWHLGSFTFADAAKSRSAERTGGRRFSKVISFTSNLDILDALASQDKNAFVFVLQNWLFGERPQKCLSMEESLIQTLAVFAEISFYKTGKGPENTVYTPYNIYSSFNDNVKEVDLVSPGEERQGSVRILFSLIKDGLNPFLAIDGHGVKISDRVSPGALREYSRRAKSLFSLMNLENPTKSINCEKNISHKIANLPHNLILFGAPGTGKSYDLNHRIQQYFPDLQQQTRITFHPEYTYNQFVGSYRPVMSDERETCTDSGLSSNERISYRYEFGPFLEVYIDALLHPGKNYVLIIEELNRANTAGVFGEIFQLLDRDECGRSCYPVTTPSDMRAEIWKRLIESEYLPEDKTLKRYGKTEATELSKTLILPANMYIWATMNSADQGVFPMDTAFKRRWSFEYKDINDGSESISDLCMCLGKDNHAVNWDTLRRKINDILLSECGVNEDKLLGPFFLSPTAFLDNEYCVNMFKNKVLLYLYEDAARMRRLKLFKGYSQQTMSYSQLCQEFDEKGEEIFGVSLREG